MSRDGVAFPDTLVGTDSHTPHVDALGVIAIGVGGLEAESVMLGRASYMRLPDIIGVELVGVRQEDNGYGYCFGDNKNSSVNNALFRAIWNFLARVLTHLRSRIAPPSPI